MRIARPALEQVREYAAERGCTVFDEGGHRFLDPDGRRSIRISEVQPGIIYLWDTVAGIISMPRDRRSTRIKGKEDAEDEGDEKANAPMDQLTLELQSGE